MTNLEKQLLAALVGLRGSNNGFEDCWCGEMPHEEDCQAGLDAVKAAIEAGHKMYCLKCGRSEILTIRPDGEGCGKCWR